MISINSALCQKEIQALLDGHQFNDIQFKFKEKKGIKLFFEINSDDQEKAVRTAKDVIKAQTWGSVLYLQVEAVN